MSHSVSSSPPSVPSKPAFFTVAEIADRLRLSSRTIRRWVNSGRLRAIRTAPRDGGRIRIAAPDLDAFLDRSVHARVQAAGGPRR